MSALSREPITKKRKLSQVVPTAIAETAAHNAESLAEANICGPADTLPSFGPTRIDKYSVPNQKYPAGLQAEIPLDHLKESRADLERPVCKATKSESSIVIDWVVQDFYTDLDNRLSQSQSHDRRDRSCTYDEALAIRYRAREIGLERFLQESVVNHRLPLHTLCMAFGILPPTVAEESPDSASLSRLRKTIEADMASRIKLRRYNSVKDAITLVRDAKNIMVITGAGVSTSLGIPDFRSHNGLYSTLGKMGFGDPESIFSRDTFEQDPRPFFSIASMILPPMDGRFTPAHAFLRLLQGKGKLLTLYTQNIDGIDLAAGISRDKLIQLHGSFETATCTNCETRVQGDEIFPAIRKGEIPKCTECQKERQNRLDQMIAMRAQNGRSVRRRTQRSSTASTTEPTGIMRPDIVFMGEPPRPYTKRFKRDCIKVDLLIVMGTSLPVEPVNIMPNRIPANVPQIYIGKHQMYPERFKKIDFDIQLIGECDVVTELLAKGCGWDLEHEMLPKDTFIEVEPWYPTRHCHEIKRKKMQVTTKSGETESDG